MTSNTSESQLHTENMSDRKGKSDDDLLSNADDNSSSQASNQKNVYSKTSNVQQLLARLAQEIDEREPSNVIHFIVDFLCKHYPEHLHGFEVIWNGDPDLEQDRILVVEFFKSQKLPLEVSAHFINAGFDTLETLCTLSTNALEDVEKFNSVRWLPGHKVRLQQTFNDITNKVRMFKEERENIIKTLRHGFPSSPMAPVHNTVVVPNTINPLNPLHPRVSPIPPQGHLPFAYSVGRVGAAHIGEPVLPAHIYKK